ncbi:MAG: hypothetical protein AAF368_12985, partial [Planctomycetota bacterium]
GSDPTGAPTLPERVLEDLDSIFFSRRRQSVSPRRCLALVGTAFACGFAAWAALDPALRQDIVVVASSDTSAPLCALIACMWGAAGIGLACVIGGLRETLGVSGEEPATTQLMLQATFWMISTFVVTLLTCVLLELGFLAAFGTPRELDKMLTILRTAPHLEARPSLLHVPVAWALSTVAVPIAVIGQGALRRRLA